MSKKRINVKYFVLSLALFFSLSSPFIIFELRHNFIQTRSILFSLIAKDQISNNRLAKLDRVLQLVVKDIGNIFGTNFFAIPQLYVFYFFLIILALLIIKKALDRNFGILLFIWILVYILFFTFNAINVSEYYLNGMAIVWILIASVFVNELLRTKNYRDFGYLVIWLFIIINLFKFFTLPINKNGYVYKKALVSFIKEDSQKHGFPCLAVSYITNPGYELGYRYLFRIEGMHVNNPDSGSPVYTIVFPLSLVGKLDKTFGALGLILPDYKEYNRDNVIRSCAGENSNLTDPLFGFTN
jgi:hypothetical protein